MYAIESENSWSQQTFKLLVALNSGSIVALLALSQALVSNGHFRDLKSFLLWSMAIFLGGICFGVIAFRSRARAMGAMIAGSGEIPTKVMYQSMNRGQTASAMSFLLFVLGAVCMGLGMALRL
ncbi:hypothetical protein [Paraburkholderia pallida]|uniref:Uncharacterized protein n=1 Tax=Paraburkholderia pallida TaxID=2547399 RepID=A0A4P7D183_9BURK|nr:hypothetical protein [Paraburkholderia pallida]QBR00480.1 hypothetical protein E1956_25940 [Paraburkholderia pallida]